MYKQQFSFENLLIYFCKLSIESLHTVIALSADRTRVQASCFSCQKERKTY
jgi:hypothetical protein